MSDEASRKLPEAWAPEPFVPRRGLRSGHAQTIAAYFLPRRLQLPLPEERLFTVANGVQVMTLCHWQERRQEALTLLIVHGLEGSCESQYMLGTTHKAWSAGMNVVRMNMRNCGGTHLLGPTLYHSGMSGDIAAVTQELIEGEHLGRVALLGFSMGGNQVLKLLGEWGKSAPPQVRAAATISAALDLSHTADLLHRLRNRLYEWNFLVSLQQTARRKQRAYPDVYEAFRWLPYSSLRRFDDKVTAPYSGFTDAEDYYTRAASSNVVEHIAVPTLILNATDDPFVQILPKTRAKLLANPNVRLVETVYGGHCAFMAEPNGYDGRWAERQAVEFLRQF